MPVLTWSCLDKPLDLDDLLVCIQASEIILTSKRLNRRLVPRLASAYNYSRSDLSVYRFLSDLQHQNLKSNLAFDIQSFFPDLDYYPRVLFKNIIVSPARWKMVLLAFKGDLTEAKNDINGLRIWLDERNITYPFRTGMADQTLLFDPQKGDDLQAFLAYLKQQKSDVIYLNEALLGKQNSVHDELGSPYHAEYLVNYSHSQTIYRPFEPTKLRVSKPNEIENYQLPGGEWLYFEIYLSEFRTNEILLKYVAEFIRQQKRHVKKWFFIRYNDPAAHLRLRFQLRRPEGLQSLVTAMDNLLNGVVKSGIVKSLELKTYVRESERYGPTRILLVEEYFFQDSKYCMGLLRTAVATDTLYVTSLLYLQGLLGICYTNLEERISFVKTIGDQFSKERKTTKAGFKNINRSYQALIDNFDNLTIAKYANMGRRQQHILVKILDLCDPGDIEPMVADLVHMHINRLFSSDQRIHELIIYQYLRKLLLARRVGL